MTTLDPAYYRKAADIIDTGGLAKGAYVCHVLGRTEHCTVGALQEATGEGLVNSSPEVQYLGHLLGLPPGCDCDNLHCGDIVSVTRWNDQPQTTAADVIALLTEAAEKLEANLP
jgi:hypothetical protein